MFGSKPRVGLDLKSLGCTEAVAAEIQDEEQLGAVLEELGIAATQEKCSESDRLADESQSEIIQDGNLSGFIEDAYEDIASTVAQQNCSLAVLGSPETPIRKRLREEAFESMNHQARTMKRVAALHSGPAMLPVGAVVKLEAPNVDRSKLDPTGIVAVVVEVTPAGLFRCATAEGVLRPCLSRVD